MAAQPLISIVDDDAGVRASLDGLMRSMGYRVALFESAEQFLSADIAAESACVVSDVQMPGGMTGIALLRTLREASRDVPVILMSAFTDRTTREAAVQAGACDTLAKPFDGDDLIRCVERALARRSA